MVYTFEVWNDRGLNDRRVDTFVRHENLVEEIYQTPGNFVKVFDNTSLARPPVILDNWEEAEQWLEMAGRKYAWKDMHKDPLSNSLSIVCTPPGEPQLVSLQHQAVDDMAGLEKVNIKNLAATGKPTVSCIPPIGIYAMGMAMQDGANKYGRFNWRTTEVTASVFFDAMMRHLLAWYCGEDHATDSKVHHMGHLQAGAAIILDGELHGVFQDNRDTGTFKKEDIEGLMSKMWAIIKKQ